MRMRRLKHFDNRKDAVSDILKKCMIEDKNHKNDVSPEYINFKEWFGNDNPMYLEVGCGMGGFAVEYAKKHPDINIVAVEINENVIIRACETVKENNITNVRFICVSADYLDRYIRANTFCGMFLNFSCPYPKNRYEMRRLTAPVFLKIYKSLLKNGAKIQQKTDNMHFFEFSIEQFSREGFVLSEVSLDLHNSDFEDNIVTEYEQKFLDLGQPIYRLVAENIKSE